MEELTPPDPSQTAIRDDAPPEQLAKIVGLLLAAGQILEAEVRFTRVLPPDQADILSHLSPDLRALLLGQLSPKVLGLILAELDLQHAIELSQQLDSAMLSKVLDDTSPDVAADVLRGLPDEMAASALEQMATADHVAPLLEYADDRAGGLMTPEFVALREDITVGQAISFVQAWSREYASHDISQVFIVDHNGGLRGTASLAQLVLAGPYQLLSLIMEHEVISVTTETDQEEVARIMERYDIHRLPVVDDAEKLVGMVGIDDIIDVFEEEATEDMFRMIGVGEGERILGPFWLSVRSRLPWLCVNLATVIAAGLVITLFQSTVVRAIALVAFLPVIAGQGGIAGTQTLTLIVRSIALGEVGIGAARRLILKELGLGLVHGVALGLLVGVIALAWQGNTYLALVAGLAMLANMIVAGISGVLVPLGFRALRIDPALASAVAVTSATDIFGLLIYLGLATLMIGLITGS